MRIPPYYHDPGWQRFFAGIVLGAIIGFAVFVFLNGVAQERQLQIIAQQKLQINELEKARRILMEEEEKQNEELEKKLTVQSITIKIDKNPKILLDGIKELEIKETILEQLLPLIGNDIESVASNRGLIFNAINNKSFPIEDKVYYVKVRSVTIYSDLQLHVVVEKVVDK